MRRDPFASRRRCRRQRLTVRFSQPQRVKPCPPEGFGNVTAAEWLETFRAGTA